MLDCLRHVQNVHLEIPLLSSEYFSTEHEVETYLNDAKWLVHLLNNSPMLKKVYICVVTWGDWSTFDVPTPASEGRRCRFELLMSPFEQLNNVEIEVLTSREDVLTPGLNIRDPAILDYIKDVQRLTKPKPDQKLIDKFFVPIQTDAPKKRKRQLDEFEKL